MSFLLKKPLFASPRPLKNVIVTNLHKNEIYFFCSFSDLRFHGWDFCRLLHNLIISPKIIWDRFNFLKIADKRIRKAQLGEWEMFAFCFCLNAVSSWAEAGTLLDLCCKVFLPPYALQEKLLLVLSARIAVNSLHLWAQVVVVVMGQVEKEGWGRGHRDPGVG